MRNPSTYLSDYFLTDIWPRFIAPFKNANSKNTYFTDINLFVEYCKKDILSVTYADCKSYFDYLNVQAAAGEIKNSTIAKKHSELSGLFNFICNNNFMVPNNFSNYFEKIEVVKVPDKINPNKILSLTDLDKLLGYLKVNNYICYLSVILAYKQMLRTSEIVKIKAKDITIDSDNLTFLRVQQPSGHIRYNKLSFDVFELLYEHTHTINGGYLISKNGAKPTSVRTLQKYLSDACISLKINSFTFNDLRNSGSINAVNNGAKLDVVMHDLGIKTNRHITRLDSLKLEYSNGSDYINIEIKK